MTRQFNAQFHCPNCNTWQTQETSFGRWIRNNPDLDSAKGYCVIDQDYKIHQYKTHGNREFQCMMEVEIKTMGADLSPAQSDTLWISDQLLRNRRDTPTKSERQKRRQSGTGVSLVYSPMQHRYVRIRHYGLHVLTFSGLGPDDSQWIRWDKTIIDEATLTKILRLDLDPDTLKPLDLRNHHKTHENQVLHLDFGSENK